MMVLRKYGSLILQKIILESFSMVIALLIGCFVYRRMNVFTKILFFQLIVWIVFYILSYVVTRYQHAQGFTKNNQWLMNLHLPLETGFLIMAAIKTTRDKVTRTFFISGYVLFLTVFTFQIVKNTLFQYSSISDVSECIIISVIFAVILYQNFIGKSENSFTLPERCMVVGILLYFAGSVPYLSLMSHIEEYHQRENSTLFHLISDVLAASRYLLLAFGFWLLSKRSLTTNVHE